jgi:hypothetical protein
LWRREPWDYIAETGGLGFREDWIVRAHLGYAFCFTKAHTSPLSAIEDHS